jgi:hypothetical protein
MSTTRLSPMVRTLLAGVMLAGAVAALPARAQDYQNDPAYYPDTQEDIVVQGAGAACGMMSTRCRSG